MSLRDQHVIEWVAMNHRKRGCGFAVFDGDGNRADAALLKRSAKRGQICVQFSERAFQPELPPAYGTHEKLGVVGTDQISRLAAELP